MSAGILHSDGGRRDLLPDAIGSGLIGLMRRGNGLALLGLAALGWIGLLSWEMPVAGHLAGASAVSHVIGKLPASFADFLLQSFGLAAAILFAVPTFWGIEQLARQKLGRPILRILTWPTCVLAASGALSALPAPASWPFARGLGGVIGDQLFALLKLALLPVGQSIASPAAGASLGLVALALFATSIAVPRLAAVPAHADVQPAFREVSFGTPDEPAPHAMSNPMPEPATVDDWRPEPAPTMQMSQPRNGYAPAFTKPVAAYEQQHHAPEPDSNQPIHVPYDDMPEDDESRRMAQRFAPASARVTPAEPEQAAQPQPWFGWRDLLGRASDAQAEEDDARNGAQPAAGQAEAAAPIALQPGAPAADHMIAPVRRAQPDPAGPYRLPAASLLSRLPPQGPRTQSGNAELMVLARKLEAAFSEFGVRAKIMGAVPGPSVTQFEIQAAPGTKTTRVMGLAGDIAKAMELRSARVAAIPGRSTLLIELPNERPDPMALRDLLESRAFRQSLHALPLPVGLALDRQPIVTDLATVPGVLIAGEPGAGKSQVLSAMLTGLLLRLSPTDLRLALIDPKRRELGVFEGIGHLLAPVASDPARASAILDWCAAEMDERHKAMSLLNQHSIATYNNAVRNALRQGRDLRRQVQTGFDPVTGRAVFEHEPIAARIMPYLAVVIDDLDVLLETGGEPVLSALQKLGNGARNAGIHLIAASSRIESDAMRRLGNAVLPARVCLKLASKAESRAALGEGGAELLLGDGDFLFSIGGAPVRGQAATLIDGDAAAVAEWVRRQWRDNHEPSLAG